MGRVLWRGMAFALALMLGGLAVPQQGNWVLWPHVDGDVRWMAAGSVVAAMLVIGMWRMARFLVTIVHELGHVLCAALVGGRPVRISLAMDTSGLATWTAPARWRVRRSIVASGGYLAAPVAGCAGTAAVAAGNAYPWLVVTGAVFAVTLVVLARSAVAVAVAFIVTAAATTVAWWAPGAAAGMVSVLSTVWLLGGLRSAYEQFRTADLAGTDAGTVRAELFMPARLVAALQLLVAGAALVGAWLVVWHSVISPTPH